MPALPAVARVQAVVRSAMKGGSGETRRMCAVMKEGGSVCARGLTHGGGWGMQLGDGMCE